MIMPSISLHGRVTSLSRAKCQSSAYEKLSRTFSCMLALELYSYIIESFAMMRPTMIQSNHRRIFKAAPCKPDSDSAKFVAMSQGIDRTARSCNLILSTLPFINALFLVLARRTTSLHQLIDTSSRRLATALVASSTRRIYGVL